MVKGRILSFLLVFGVALVGLAQEGSCTGVAVTNPAVGVLSGGTTAVTFNVSWTYSWRASTAPANWDAVWLFVKFRKNGGQWAHASLNQSGHSAPAGFTTSNGLVDTAAAFNISTNPVVGVFLYRNANGAGTSTANNVALSWNYSTDGVLNTDAVEVQVFGVEMVYVPEGAFFAGDKNTAANSLRQGSADNDPWHISSESEIVVTNSAGSGTGQLETTAEFYYPGEGDAAGSSFSIPAAFPKGYQPFYIMKGEISQGQWTAFFNTLTSSQQATRDVTSASGKNTDALTYRNNVSWSGSGRATLPDQGAGANYESIAMNYLSWADVAAYLDWSGLRPMSELEYERAGRGPYPSLAGEYAWGTTTITAASVIVNPGKTSEYALGAPNAIYGNVPTVQGPMRVGCLTYASATRIGSGAGYYGAMNLSDNLKERVVTVGRSSGRSFEGKSHGNGSLDSSGDANAASWPVTDSVGTGFRGSAWNDLGTLARLSDRTAAAETNTTRLEGFGGRGVRTAP